MPLYFGGIPTGPDVEILIKTFGIPAPGTVIPYADIASSLGLEGFESSRFKSVTEQWRKKMDREHNLVFRCIPGVAFEAATGSVRVDVAARGYKMGIRKVVRSANIATKTDRKTLTPEEARTCDHLAKVGAAHLLAARTSAKMLQFPEAKKP